MALTYIAPNRGNIIGVVPPYDRVDEINDVGYQRPGDVDQGTGVAGSPMPGGGYRYQKYRNSTEKREAGDVHG
jgi:hypothetical protein